MRIEYETDLDDRHEALKVMVEMEQLESHVRQIRRNTVIIALVFIGLLLIGSAWGLTMLGIPLRSPHYGIIVVTVLIWSFMWGYRNFALSGAAMRFEEVLAHTARTMCGPGVDGLTYMELTESKLILADTSSHATHRWPCFRKIIRCPTCTVCQLLNGSCVIVPMRAFDYQLDAYKRFVSEIERLNEEAGGWDGIVEQFLRDYRFNCPDCGYQLHMVSAARCPECGKDITHEDFQIGRIERIDQSR